MELRKKTVVKSLLRIFIILPIGYRSTFDNGRDLLPYNIYGNARHTIPCTYGYGVRFAYCLLKYSIAYGVGQGWRYRHSSEKVASKGGPATRLKTLQVCNGRRFFYRGIYSGLFTPALSSNQTLKCRGQTSCMLYANKTPDMKGPGYEECNFRACDNRGGCILTSIIPRRQRNGIDICCGRNYTGWLLTKSGYAVLKCFRQR